MLAPDAGPQSAALSPTQAVAHSLVDVLKRAYSDDGDVSVQIRSSTVTISRGPKAVQIFVVGDDRFQVSTKRRETFRTRDHHVKQAELAEIIKEVIGPSTPSA